MMTSVTSDPNGEDMNVFLVGNNPAEMSDINDRISSFKKPFFRTIIAFDLKRIFRHIRRSRPVSILIDDRLNRRKLNRLIKRIHRNPKTREIPVTLLKSSNNEFRINAEIDDYILKENLTPENLKKTIINSRRLRRTSIYLYKSYKKSRNILQKIWLDLKYLF